MPTRKEITAVEVIDEARVDDFVEKQTINILRNYLPDAILKKEGDRVELVFWLGYENEFKVSFSEKQINKGYANRPRLFHNDKRIKETL
jgi:hypothetical protein